MAGVVSRRLSSGAAVAGRRPPAAPARRLRRLDDRRVARDPLLQQQLDGADHRLGVEPAGHRVVEQGVGQGHQAHPLVVGHVRPDDDRPLPLGEPVGRVVDRLVEAVGPLGPLGGEAAEVLQGLARATIIAARAVA